MVWLAEPLADAGPGHRSRSLGWPLGSGAGRRGAGSRLAASLRLSMPSPRAEQGSRSGRTGPWSVQNRLRAGSLLRLLAWRLQLSWLRAAVVRPSRGFPHRSPWWSVCVAAVPLLGTTLHTWNRWVPAEVQQTYGTEYSRLVGRAASGAAESVGDGAVGRRGRSSRPHAGARPGAGHCAQGGSAMRRLGRIVMALAIVAVLGHGHCVPAHRRGADWHAHRRFVTVA